MIVIITRKDLTEQGKALMDSGKLNKLTVRSNHVQTNAGTFTTEALIRADAVVFLGPSGFVTIRTPKSGRSKEFVGRTVGHGLLAYRIGVLATDSDAEEGR